MAIGEGVKLCKYKASDTPETLGESLEHYRRKIGYGHWGGGKSV